MLLFRLFSLIVLLVSGFVTAMPIVQLPDHGLSAKQLAVIVNDRDPLSLDIANYYQQQRNIPSQNLIHIEFDPGKSVMEPGEFAVLLKVVESKLPDDIQAYALTWVAPYRVGCMSISSAFAFGYDIKYCAQGCQPTQVSQYADSNVKAPFDELGIRPTMLLAAESFADAKSLIDRGVSADNSQPAGSAYLVETNDAKRSVRKVIFPRIQQQLGSVIPVNILQTDALRNAKDVVFYFTGASFIDDIDSNTYLPGAIADHLTSAGGVLTGRTQMSALRWLQAGVTGSYGTVVEPCNLLGKFPSPLIVMNKYLRGETLLEAYWKSVGMPGQGVFIGEPLAKPYLSYNIRSYKSYALLLINNLSTGFYQVSVADNPNGPFSVLLDQVELKQYQQPIELPLPLSVAYKVERL